MDLQLAGKNALVTGGSRGIGKAIARALAEEGVQVVIASRGLEALQRTAEELTAETGTKVAAFAVDTGDDSSVAALAANAINLFGHIDILVNNAATPGGVGPVARIADVTAQRLLDDVNIKVSGYLRTAQALAPHFVQTGWGRIINIGGLAARRTGNYVASVRNAAVTSITKNLADELGPKGITVNAIHPGATRTERTDPASEGKYAETVTIGRIVDASEIAWLVTVLASPKSIALNGETLQAGGGSFGNIDY